MSEIITALANNKHIRVMAINATQLVKQAVESHGCAPTSAAALGRTMAIASLMAAQLKNKNEMVSIIIRGENEIKTIRVDAHQNGNIVGFVDRKDILKINEKTHKLDVGQAIGAGTLTVSRNLGLKDEYSSTIDLVSGEIGDDFAMYFVQSEQLPSAVSLGVLINEQGEVISAGGLLIQMMPGHEEVDVLMAQHVVDHLKPISQIFYEGMSCRELVESLFDEVEIMGQSHAQFVCHYDKQSMADVVKTLSFEELKEIVEKGDGLDIECHYCSKIYHFNTQELTQLISEKTDVKN